MGKRCSNCKQIKTLNGFGADKAAKDGLQHWCKICRSLYAKAHRAEIAVYYKAWVAEHNAGWTYLSTMKGYLHNRWQRMMQRCNNPKDVSFKRYGACGVHCLFTSKSFFTHVTEDLGYTSVAALKTLHIHRIDNGHYCVGGIEFLTPAAHGAAHRELRGLEHR